jgi:hypothetical protein
VERFVFEMNEIKHLGHFGVELGGSDSSRSNNAGIMSRTASTGGGTWAALRM